MTPLKRALIEKAGHDHGFEHTVSAPGAAVTLGSARHQAKAEVSWAQQGYAMALVRHLLGLSNGLKLRWLAPGHAPYLLYHRDQFQTVNGWMA